MLIWILLALTFAGTRNTAEAAGPPTLIAQLPNANGSAVGPSGDLFVARGLDGVISRVNPNTGQVTTFASGLPQAIVGLGGVMDVAFLGNTAYALVTLVGSDLGGNNVVGIYRVDGPNSFTVVADIGAWALANPPNTAYFVPTGLQYALENYRGGFLVSDGHHNRVLFVTLKGEITEFAALANVVPTGLAVSGHTVYLSLAGPVPHLPQDGKVVTLEPNSAGFTEVASGAKLMVDVEFGRGRQLYGLSQGIWDGVAAGSPALPNTGALVKVNDTGTFSDISTGLDRPTSLEVIGNTAYVIGLGGGIWRIENVSGPPFGN
jgi:hypothetical protein